MSITGVDNLIIGCGYLGRRVAVEWLRQGRSVAALTRSPSRAADLRSDGIEPIVGDVTDSGSLASLPSAGTILYSVGFDRTTGHSRHAVSIQGLANVLHATAGRAERWIYISSTSVYGQSAGEVVDESSPTEPVQENGQIGLEAERLLRQHVPAAIILRLAGIYGPGRLLRRVSELQSTAPVSGNPDAWLNLIHVDDAVAAVLAAESRGRPGETYLVCDDRPIRRREYYELLARLAAAPAPVFGNTQPRAGRGSGELNKRCSNRRLREELAVALRYPTIAAGLPQAIGDSLGQHRS